MDFCGRGDGGGILGGGAKFGGYVKGTSLGGEIFFFFAFDAGVV